MRCLALAQAWQDQGGECIFAMAESTAAAEERIRGEKFEVVTDDVRPPALRRTRRNWSNSRLHHHASWVVVDGYQFDVEYQRAAEGCRTENAGGGRHGTRGRLRSPIWYWTRTLTPQKISISAGNPIPGFCSVPAMRCCVASSSPGGVEAGNCSSRSQSCW